VITFVIHIQCFADQRVGLDVSPSGQEAAAIEQRDEAGIRAKRTRLTSLGRNARSTSWTPNILNRRGILLSTRSFLAHLAALPGNRIDVFQRETLAVSLVLRSRTTSETELKRKMARLLPSGGQRKSWMV
jgi:hypothetical protein